MIYLDSHSTTPIDPGVFEAMKPYFFERFGNASHGLHRFNWEAQAGVSHAREQIAKALGAHEKEILFTGSATEANHLALLGLESHLKESKRTRILSLPIEHASVLGPLELLSERGFTIEWLAIDRFGRVDLAALESTLGPDVGIVSIALANHEVGTIQDLRAIADRAHARGAFVHTDAVQALGKIPFTADSIGADLITVSAHKIHGPKGAGALFVRRKNPRVPLEPLFLGGGQERGFRPGTPNTPAIAGFGAAVEIARERLSDDAKTVSALRDFLWESLSTEITGLRRNSPLEGVLPNNLNVSIEGIDGAALFGRLRTVAVSNASACLNGTSDHSQVLKALGVPKALARATLRFGLSRFNTRDEIVLAVNEISEVVRELRRMEREFAEQTGT